MKLIGILAASAVVALAGCSSFPNAGRGHAHEAHHPDETASKVEPAAFDQQMETMRDMHRKMMAATTPAERAALRKEHMQAMQGGMAMMGRMGGGRPMMGRGSGAGMPMQCSGTPSACGGPPTQKDMAQRMDMMEMMMQMMLDREAATPPAAR